MKWITFAEIQAAFPELFIELRGDSSRAFCRVSPIESPAQDSLVFVSTEKDLDRLKTHRFAGLILPTQVWERHRPHYDGQTPLLSTPNLSLAMARILDRYFATSPMESAAVRRHPTAVIASSADISESAIIGAHVVIGENAKVGPRSWIGAQSVVEENVLIGAECRIHPLVFVGSGTCMGDRCEIKPHTTIGGEGFGFAHDEKGIHHRIPQIGVVILEENVSIGSHCAIDRATLSETRIGRGTKIDNFVHIAHNCKIGAHNIFTAGLMIAGSSEVGSHVVTGGRVSITDHVRVTDRVQLAGLSGVTNDIDTPGAYGGYPLQPLKDALRTTATLAHLPSLKRQVGRILKFLNLPDVE